MKKILFFFAAIFTLSQGNSEEPRFEACEKIYVQPNQISISEHGIFVYVANEWLEVESLNVDELGVYGSISELCTWECSKCGTINSAFRRSCSKCGKLHTSK